MKIIYDCLLLGLQTTKFIKAYPYSFQTNTELGEASDFNGGNHIFDMSSVNLSQFSYMYTIDSVILALLLCLLTYYVMVYNDRLISHDKFRLALSMLNRNQTPLALIRNQLVDMATENLPEKMSGKLEETLVYTNNVIECYQNVVALEKMNGKAEPVFSVIECELNTFITSVINQCRIYANSCQVKLKFKENKDYINCRINETVMNAAIQCLLYRIIEITTPKECINVTISHTAEYWKLSVSNGKESGKVARNIISAVSTLFPIYRYGNLKVVERVIRQHGGRLIGRNCGKVVNIQIIVPVDCQCQDKGISLMRQHPVLRNIVQPIQKIRAGLEEEVLKTEKKIQILLIMDDKKFSDYLSKTLSDLFQIYILDDPEMVIRNLASLETDIIIIDESVGGMRGDELCSKIKADEKMANIPIMLLLNSCDNENYLSHIKCGANRLESRMTNLCKLKADIRMLVDSSASYRRLIKKLVTNRISTTLSGTNLKDEQDREFMKRVLRLLEEHPLEEKYTVKQLCKDIGMCQTLFYNKIKELTGYSPERLILSYKMDKARDLLLTRQYKIEELATMVGYADGKYFTKVFKEFYLVCPKKYLEEVYGKNNKEI